MLVQSRSLRGIVERVEQRISERDRESAHADVGGWKEAPLIAVRDGKRLDLDQLRVDRARWGEACSGDEQRSEGRAVGWHPDLRFVRTRMLNLGTVACVTQAKRQIRSPTYGPTHDEQASS